LSLRYLDFGYRLYKASRWRRLSLSRTPRWGLSRSGRVNSRKAGCQSGGLERPGALLQLLRQSHLRLAFNLADELRQVLDLRAKYSSVPMSLADACLVRLSEILPDPVVVTTDADFRIYRRHSRQVIPCLMP